MTRAIVVTGASRGVGEHLCIRLLNAGHTIVAVSRSEPKGLEAVAERIDACRRLTVLLRDLTDLKTASTLMHEIEGIVQCDALINNAAVAYAGLTATLSVGQVSAMIKLNLMAPIMLCRLAGMYMIRRRSGRIINISSVAAKSALNGLAVYGATKAALEQFSKGLARELGPRGVRVNCVAPGFMPTAMSSSLSDDARSSILRRTASGRYVRIEDVCAAVEYLLTDKAVTGQVISVDEGFSL